jgi:hypothetical protein
MRRRLSASRAATRGLADAAAIAPPGELLFNNEARFIFAVNPRLRFPAARCSRRDRDAAVETRPSKYAPNRRGEKSRLHHQSRLIGLINHRASKTT